ncbi:MAG: hypothetical protein ACLSHC_01515 [Bilophila wadsworthia]
MDISGLGASKLLEALEKLGVSRGPNCGALARRENLRRAGACFEDELRAGWAGRSVRAGRC